MNINFLKRRKNFYIDSCSSNKKWITIFEDDGQTGYMYLCSSNENGKVGKIIEHLCIYNKIDPPIKKCKEVSIIWSVDSNRTALIVDGQCLGIFDLLNKRKLNALINDNKIVSIEKEIFDNGISEFQGSPLRSEEL